MGSNRRHAGIAALVLCAAAATGAHAADAVREWNEIALRTTARATLNPPLEARQLAIVQAAVFDALAAVGGGWEPYATRERAAGASVDAAAAAAAHRALVQLFPEQRAELDGAYAASLAALPESRARADGIALGERVADALVASRANDGADAAVRVPYTPGSGEGAWVPTPPAAAPALDPGWGTVRPFVTPPRVSFRPAPPPALRSAEYARDLAEVAEIGRADSTRRTAAQSDVARFWAPTASQIWNPAARMAIADRGLGPVEAARVLALLDLAGADAIIAAWDAKYAFGQWRPVTAIRAGGDASWTPLLVTPPFPDYVAGHATYAGAAERVLSRLLGPAPPRPLRLTSSGAPGVVLTYTTFEAIADDVVDARVWAGVHWRTSCTRGREVGRRVGDHVVDHALRARP